jgi:hypothetical protein
MKRILVVQTLAILLLSTLAGCGSNETNTSTTVSDTVASDSAPVEAFISDCGYGYSQKPSSITLTCADGGMYIEQITYSSWDDTSASANGILYSNSCDPDCASGVIIPNPVEISFSDTKYDANNKVIFSMLTITAENELYNGTNTESFDIGIEQEGTEAAPVQEETTSSGGSAKSKMQNLLSRLNGPKERWQINEVATSPYGVISHRQLGLFNEPDYVIECNLNYSGTWLFLYSNENDAYDAFNSNYFFRNSNYSADLMYDPQTNLIVLLHTSMGGNKTCINSALKQIDYYATD